jgi:adenine-specific DNA-methyltransferase
MGTKRELSEPVWSAIALARDGVVLDAFSGMCSVGESGPAIRQVWANDIQSFARCVSTAVLTSETGPLNPVQLSDIVFDHFNSCVREFTAHMGGAVSAEGEMLDCLDFDSFELAFSKVDRAYCSDKLNIVGRNYSLFSATYANNYFGIRQAVEIDALVSSINFALRSGSLSLEQQNWALVALGRAMLRIANAPGHFAQFLKPKAGSYKVYLRQRRRSVWEEFLTSIDTIKPAHSSDWRVKNRTFNEDSLDLLERLSGEAISPSVVYADPPYTDDQYSRFYHLLETLVLYDYPAVTGAGLYRPGRFTTPFSLKSQVATAFSRLVNSVAEMNADLVLSYPTNGLLYKAGGDPRKMLLERFSSVERVYASQWSHSTFGASKGHAKAAVVEQIFLAKL